MEIKLFPIVIFLLFACNKYDETITIAELSIAQNETLRYELCRGIPVEGEISISNQADNYSISEIKWDTMGLYYEYIPELGFSGRDFVEITSKGSSGGGNYFTTSINQIKIIVE